MKVFSLILCVLAFASIAFATQGQSDWCNINSPSFQQQHAYMISRMNPSGNLWQQNMTVMFNAIPGTTTFEDAYSAVFYQSNTWNPVSCCFEFVQGYPRGPGVYAFNRVQSCVAPPQYLVPPTSNAPPSVVRAQYNVTWMTVPLFDEAAISYLTGINEALSANSGLTVFNGPDGKTYFDEVVNLRSPIVTGNDGLGYYSQNAYYAPGQLPYWEYIVSQSTNQYSTDIANCFAQFEAGTMPYLNDPLASMSGVNNYPVPLCVFSTTSARSIGDDGGLPAMYKGRLQLNQRILSDLGRI